MGNRPFPSFFMYKDVQGKWRWTFHASNHEPIAVSSESYETRRACERGIEIMNKAPQCETWMPTELINAA
jgi:uncharacterized protein